MDAARSERLLRALVHARTDLVPAQAKHDIAGVTSARAFGAWCDARDIVPPARKADAPARLAPPRRRTVSPSAPAAAFRRSAGGPIDRVAVGQSMERFIAGRIAAYEASSGEDSEPERTARTVSHYARALGLVRGYLRELEEERRRDDEPPARSLSELRDELRRHLERIWDEGRNAAGPDDAGSEPGGM